MARRGKQWASQKPMTARELRISSPLVDRAGCLPGGHPEGDQPAERRQRPQALVEDRAAGHLQHDVDRVAAVGLPQPVAQALRAAVDGDVRAELQG